MGSPHINTHLFHGGVIIASKRVNYEPTVDAEIVKALMQAQHKAIMKSLKHGEYDSKIRAYLGAKLAVEPPRPEPTPTPEPSAPPVENLKPSQIQPLGEPRSGQGNDPRAAARGNLDRALGAATGPRRTIDHPIAPDARRAPSASRRGDRGGSAGSADRRGARGHDRAPAAVCRRAHAGAGGQSRADHADLRAGRRAHADVRSARRADHADVRSARRADHADLRAARRTRADVRSARRADHADLRAARRATHADFRSARRADHADLRAARRTRADVCSSHRAARRATQRRLSFRTSKNASNPRRSSLPHIEPPTPIFAPHVEPPTPTFAAHVEPTPGHVERQEPIPPEAPVSRLREPRTPPPPGSGVWVARRPGHDDRPFERSEPHAAVTPSRPPSQPPGDPRRRVHAEPGAATLAAAGRSTPRPRRARCGRPRSRRAIHAVHPRRARCARPRRRRARRGHACSRRRRGPSCRRAPPPPYPSTVKPAARHRCRRRRSWRRVMRKESAATHRRRGCARRRIRGGARRARSWRGPDTSSAGHMTSIRSRHGRPAPRRASTR